MWLPLLITAFALASIALGVVFHREHRSAGYLAAIAGGILLAIALFALLPEIAADLGWWKSCLLVALLSVVLFALDRLLEDSHAAWKQSAIWLLLLAAAGHSFLDGWAIRQLATPAAAPVVLGVVAVPLAIALHKIPEGIALGYVSRRALVSLPKAALSASAAELCTVFGALLEPGLNRRGAARFPSWWPDAILLVLAASFFFAAIHTVVPRWKQPGVPLTFCLTFVLLSVAALCL